MSDKPYHHLKEDYEGVCALSRRQDAEIERLRQALSEAYRDAAEVARAQLPQSRASRATIWDILDVAAKARQALEKALRRPVPEMRL